MASDESLRSIQTGPELGSWRQVDWGYALGLFTAALVFQGAVTIFHLLLPNHPIWINVSAFAVFFIWRFGVHKMGFFPWAFGSRWGRERRSSFSFPQAVVQGFAYFVFMLVLVTFQKLYVSSVDLIIATVFGIATGTYSGWYTKESREPSSS
jgi:hypothetical protein